MKSESMKSEKKLFEIIRKLKNNKASGLDGVSVKMLKLAYPAISYHMVTLFNLIIRDNVCYTLIAQLSRVQKRLARTLLWADYRENSLPLFRKFNCLCYKDIIKILNH